LSSDIAPESVGQRLRRLRLERGLSQRDLAGPGVSYAYISRIEADARRPSVKALRKLATALGVTAEYLETGSEVSQAEARELRFAEVELRLRLEGTVPAGELEEFLADAIAAADVAAEIRARIALGLSAAAQGNEAEAIAQLEEAVASDLISPASRPDVFATLGHAYAATGRPRRSAELFERALEDLDRVAPENTGARVRFSTYLSYALTDLGDLEGARRVVEDALRHSDSVDEADPYTRVRLHWSLGRISHEQAKPLAALEHFRRAVALLEASDDTVHQGRARLSCAAAILAAGEDVGEASSQLAQAEQLLGSRPEPGDLTVLRRHQSVCASRSGDFATGVQRARDAQAAAANLPNQAGLATWVLAEALAGLGEPDAAAAFAGAVEQLEQHGTVREHAEVLRAYGRYLRTIGKETKALDVLERAAEVATGLQSGRSPIIK
jgi:transcriptional regulator with XRE-family HTH domain